MPTRHKVADADELAAGDRVIAEIEGVEVAVFNVEGDYHAMANYCVHQGGPLCEGELRGSYGVGEDGWEWTYDDTKKTVVCPWHGWKFDVTTGRNVNDEGYAAPTYEVDVEDGAVYVLR